MAPGSTRGGLHDRAAALSYTPGVFPLPNEIDSANFYKIASKQLSEAGYQHYEISSYCKPGYECKHNVTYWQNRPFYAFGLGSVSYINGVRTAVIEERKKNEVPIEPLRYPSVASIADEYPQSLCKWIWKRTFRVYKITLVSCNNLRGTGSASFGGSTPAACAPGPRCRWRCSSASTLLHHCGALGVDSDEDDEDEEGGKVVGELEPREIVVLLSMCWVIAWSRLAPRVSGGEEGGRGSRLAPDVCTVCASCPPPFLTRRMGLGGFRCREGGVSAGVHVLGDLHYPRDWQLPLAICVGQESSVSTGNTTFDTSDAYLLTRGRAWSISLSVRSTLSEKKLSASVIGMDTEELIYRSMLHGKGLSRFWSCVEGYKGPSLIPISTFSNAGSNNVDEQRHFYGSSGFLCATYPIFRMLLPSACKEKNIMYCHLHTRLKTYEATPKPLGLAFGGSIGNEKVFIDEDFSKVTIRHHAVDKTYQHVNPVCIDALKRQGLFGRRRRK
ncbi:hypothetical protein ZWY2020_049173, partial [Hordeum vulgare]